MRISTRGSTEMIKANLARPSNRLVNLYGQLTSGKRLQKPSDDPLAVVRTVKGQDALKEIASRKFVLQMGQQLVGATDTALGEVSSSLRRCLDLSLEGASPTMEADEYAAIAAEIRQLSDGMVTTSNMSVHGQYIFSGSQIDTAPFEIDDTANLPVLYNGNHQAPSYSLSQSERVSAGVTGAEVFNFPGQDGTRPLSGTDQDTFSLLESIADAVERGDVDAVADLRGDLERNYNHVVAMRGQNGVVAQRYERSLSLAEDSELRISELLSTDRDVDYASAIVDVTQQQTVYSAALQMTSKLLEMPDLFDLPW